MKLKPLLPFLFGILAVVMVTTIFLQPGKTSFNAHAASANTPRSTPTPVDDLKGPLPAGIHWSMPRSSKLKHPGAPTGFGPVFYHLGRVMTNSMQVYLIFWEPSGSSVSSQYNADITQYFQDVGDSGLYQNNSQYFSFFGRPLSSTLITFNPVIVTDQYPAKRSLTDSDIHQEITKTILANQWEPAYNTIFLIYTASGEVICSKIAGGCNNNQTNGWCGYHADYANSSFTVKPIYAVVAYPTTGCYTPTSPNDLDADSAISVSSHEQMEAATDPFGHGYSDIQGYEIGDKCSWDFGTPSLDNNLANVEWNGHFYIVQQEWSNSQNGCVLSGTGPQGGHAIVHLYSSGHDACQANSIPANDDNSTSAVALPFTPNFGGTSYSSAYISNNGYVTFDTPLSNYTPFPLTTTSSVIVAPFFADVDTRGTGSSLVTYGSGTYEKHATFCVDWVNVGYFDQHTDKINSFQLLLVDRSDKGAGDFDIIMNYNQIQWETGDASYGNGGLGGLSARVGYSNGSTMSFELPGSGINGDLLDSNHSGLSIGSWGTKQIGRYIYMIRNTGSAIPGSTSSKVQPPTPLPKK